MTGLFSDTHPDMEALQILLWRQSNPTKKMAMLAQLNLSLRRVALAGLRQEFPGATEAQLLRKLAERM
jgi:hypothetical protein